MLRRLDRQAVSRPLKPNEQSELVEALTASYGDHLALEPLYDDVAAVCRAAVPRLVTLGVLRDRPDLRNPAPGPLEQTRELAGEILGARTPDLFTRVTDRLIAAHEARLKERTRRLNWELFDRAVGAATWGAIEELNRVGRDKKLTTREPTPEELQNIRASLEKPFADRLMLWQKSKDDLVAEMDTVIQMPGWGNIFTQPIINRIEMLSTGVRSPIGVKIFGEDLDQLQRVTQEVAGVLREVRGAANVVPDQIVGKGPLALMRSHRPPPSWLTNKPVSPPAKTVCASVGWATSAWMRLLSGKGARCRTHDFPASGLCQTPQPTVPRHML